MTKKYYWLSFCDNDRPKGKKFLGIIITEADSSTEAMKKTHRLGINPGGEIQFSEIECEFISLDCIDRLMTIEELREKRFID